jgi:hypothetical protein
VLHNTAISSKSGNAIVTALVVQQQMRKAIRDWLDDLMVKRRLSARAIAEKGEVSPSTVYRALDADGSFVMSTKTLGKIAAAYNLQLPEGLRSGNAPEIAGFDDELSPYRATSGTKTPHNSNVELSNTQSLWQIASLSLNLEGYMPGDVVEIDSATKPLPNDIVCAQVYNLQRGSAETVLRKFLPPYLLTRSTDWQAESQPLYIDNQRVVIVGTVIAMRRDRAA